MTFRRRLSRRPLVLPRPAGGAFSLVIITASMGVAAGQETLPTIHVGQPKAHRAAQSHARGAGGQNARSSAPAEAPAAAPAEAPAAAPAATPVTDAQSPTGGPVIGAPANSPSTTYVVDQQGMQLATGGGGTNPLRAIAFLPSVDAPDIDAYGLVNLPGGYKGVRIRGQVSQHGDSISLFDGAPLSAVNPGPGATWMIDSENIRQIRLYEGPVPSNVNSFFTLPGVIDNELRWPEKKMGAEINQSFGSSSFLRTFGRVDTGEFLNGTTKAFVSGSWTDAHQWRGPGHAPQGKSGFSAGLETTPVDAFDAKIFAAKSSFNENTLAGLNYYQASNLDAYRWYGFLPVSSKVPTVAVNYYGYNLQNFDSWTGMGEFTLRMSDSTRLVVKPYFFREDGYYLDGMSSGMVRKWSINHASFGVTTELQSRIADTDLKVGHWYARQNLPGPPTDWEMFAPNILGGLTSPKYPILSVQTSPHELNTAYAMATRDQGPWHAQLGARYIWEHMAGINEQYSKPLVGDVPYSWAVGLSPGVVLANSVNGFTVGTFLPYGSLAYDLTKNLQLKVSAGGGYGGPAFDAWPAYQQNAALFQKAGLTANSVWQSIRPETSAMVDWGFRWSYSSPYGSGYIEPTAFYSRNHAKNVAYDPGIGTPYSQNVGESETLGAQAIGHYSPVQNVDLFSSLGYQHEYFVRDLPSLPFASATTLQLNRVTGRQLPDVPYWISTSGAKFMMQEFSFTPIVHYVGGRAGDTTGLQPISGYATVDLNFGYEQKTNYGVLNDSLSVINVFDKAYIGQINNGYYQQTSSSGIYFPGAPRTVVAKIGLKF